MTDRRKIILLICDGMGDRPVDDFGGKTPLQEAETPNMDSLASMGQTGIMDVIRPGVTPGSDTAHLSLLGYDTEAIYTGRGPFEAAGTGIHVQGGDVALRCNFGTIENGRIVDRRAGRINKGTSEIAKSIDGMAIEDVKVIFREGVEHRAALVLRGPGLHPDVSDIDPHTLAAPLEAAPISPDAKKTARILNKFMKKSMDILGEHPVNIQRKNAGEMPANIILPRGAGIVPTIMPINEATGMKVGCVAGVTLVKGVCRTAGLYIEDVEGATGGVDTNILAKVKKAVEMLDQQDMVMVNIKAPDLAGHDGDPHEKTRIIERIDAAVGNLLDNMPQGTILAVTADHSTPCSYQEHTGDPVPLVIYGHGQRKDNSSQYDEVACSHGGIGRILGSDLMPILKNMGGYSGKYGS